MDCDKCGALLKEIERRNEQLQKMELFSKKVMKRFKKMREDYKKSHDKCEKMQTRIIILEETAQDALKYIEADHPLAPFVVEKVVRLASGQSVKNKTSEKLKLLRR